MKNSQITLSTLLKLKSLYPDIVQHIVDQRPDIYPDGNIWCCLSYDDLKLPTMGCGDSEYEALENWEKAFINKHPEL